MKSSEKQHIYSGIRKLLNRYKYLVMGIIAVIFLYLSVAGMVSVTTPTFSMRGDTTRHVDYVWRFYNGEIPRYEDKVTFKPFVERGLDSYQNAAANPPFFYIIHAPLVGPYLNSGEWSKGILIGRAINLFIGVLCILTLAWAGWLYGGKRRELFAVAVPAMSTLTYWFLILNKYYALDALIVLQFTLSLITLHKILVHGLRAKYIGALLALSVTGMLTKATFSVMIFTVFVGIFLAGILEARGIKRQSVLKGVFISFGIMVLVAITAGWFYYYWNYKTSGQWFRPFTDETLYTSRPYKSLKDVLYSPVLWSLMYAQYAYIPVLSTMIASFAAAGALITKRISKKMLRKDMVLTFTLILLAITFLGTFATQITHGVGYGSINFRYLLPAIFPISLFLSFGLLEFERAKGLLVALAAIIMSGTTLLSIRVGKTEEGLLASPLVWGKAFPKMYKLGLENGVPVYFTKGLVVMFVLGAVLLIVAMYQLNRKHMLNQSAK